MIIEACVETLEEAIYAEENGAHQIELCSDLANDGLTPDFSLVQDILFKTDLKVKIMIRARAGNFVYSEEEIEQMSKQIQTFNALNIDGYVFGALSAKMTLDIQTINVLTKFVPKGKSITIHKAIDSCTDPVKETHILIKKCPKVNFILSSGGAITANEGQDVLKKMNVISGENIKIIAAGSILKANLQALHKKLQFQYYHGRRIV